MVFVCFAYLYANRMQMEKQVYVSIILDKRRIKANGKYPVKLRVFTPMPRKQKLYPTKFEFTDTEFYSIWETVKTRSEFKESKIALQEIENIAETVANKLTPFSFNEFENKLNINKKEGTGILAYYNTTIDKFKSLGQYGTASTYDLSQKSILAYLKHTTGKESLNLPFADITPDFLSKYEKFMVDTNSKSITTVSIYLRSLRALFNSAIADGEVDKALYPFGNRKYQIPAAKSVKKALSNEQLKMLYSCTPRTFEQVRGRDFWFLSYNCNGMNFKDIALIKNEDIVNETLVFYRAKTKNTNRSQIKPVVVSLNSYAISIIEKYRGINKSPNAYVFDIIEQGQTEEVKRTKIQNFVKGINQGVKRLAKEIGLPTEISTYWARHSFATSVIRNGASIEFVSEALSHSNTKTTQLYFAGFEDSQKREIMDKLMNF
jgi:integrase/recombinase XerD